MSEVESPRPRARVSQHRDHTLHSQEPPDDADSVVEIPLSSLLSADTPRLGGIDQNHARTLAQTDEELEPILVHYESRRVIDGEHRVRAAQLRGASMIRARLFSGTEADAFVMAVKANLTHGLPLSMTERRAAVVRILQSFPIWSDRAIGQATGVSNKTVAAIRACPTEEVPQLDTRIGRDGRARPLKTAEGRLRASEMLKAQPDASLRSIASETGLSPTTVRDVKEKLRRGLDPVVPQQRTRSSTNRLGSPEAQSSKKIRAESVDWDSSRAVENLKRDPSLRFNQAGKQLLQWLSVHVNKPTNVEGIICAVPPHCSEVIVRIALHCAAWWSHFAEQLEQCGEPEHDANTDVHISARI